jgi:hypothetical protein
VAVSAYAVRGILTQGKRVKVRRENKTREGVSFRALARNRFCGGEKQEAAAFSKPSAVFFRGVEIFFVTLLGFKFDERFTFRTERRF